MEITKEIILDLSKIPTNKRDQVKKEVGDLIIDEVLRKVGSGRSPLQGSPSWRKLNPEYAEENKGGNRTPNLDLTGEMLDSLKATPTPNGVKIGYGEGTPDDVLDRADGHNNFSGRSTLPLRRFIPKDNEEYGQDIMNRVTSVVKSYETQEPSTFNRTTTGAAPTNQTSISISDLLSRDLFDRLFNGES